jgi:ComF family protein
MFAKWRALGTWLLDQLLPAECLGCSTTVPEALGFCVSCRSKLELNWERELEDLPMFAPYRFSGPVSTAIHRFKYEERSEYARRFAQDTCFSAYPPWLDSAMLVPVPIHPVRLVERGYDQAGLLARALAARWRCPVDLDLLHRSRFATRQVGLGRAARLTNVRGAFEVRGRGRTSVAPVESHAAAPRGPGVVTRIVLVDDVVTTGATVRACIDSFDEARFAVVGVIALARAGDARSRPEHNQDDVAL